MTRRLSLGFVWGIMCLAALVGCAKKEAPTGAEADDEMEVQTQTPIEPAQPGSPGVGLKDVLVMWENGRQQEAARQFVAIRWNDPSALDQMPVLTMSESQFRLLSSDEQTQVVAEAMKLSGQLRKVMFFVAAVGDKLASTGDKQGAKTHYEAVRSYGETLSQPERLEIVRLHGTAAVQYAEKRLIGAQ